MQLAPAKAAAPGPTPPLVVVTLQGRLEDPPVDAQVLPAEYCYGNWARHLFHAECTSEYGAARPPPAGLGWPWPLGACAAVRDNPLSTLANLNMSSGEDVCELLSSFAKVSEKPLVLCLCFPEPPSTDPDACERLLSALRRNNLRSPLHHIVAACPVSSKGLQAVKSGNGDDAVTKQKTYAAEVVSYIKAGTAAGAQFGAIHVIPERDDQEMTLALLRIALTAAAEFKPKPAPVIFPFPLGLTLGEFGDCVTRHCESLKRDPADFRRSVLLVNPPQPADDWLWTAPPRHRKGVRPGSLLKAGCPWAEPAAALELVGRELAMTGCCFRCDAELGGGEGFLASLLLLLQGGSGRVGVDFLSFNWAPPAAVEREQYIYTCYYCDQAFPLDPDEEPYHKYDFTYCSIKCLNLHRKQNFVEK